MGRFQVVSKMEATTLNRIAFLFLQPALIFPLVNGVDLTAFQFDGIALYGLAQLVVFGAAVLVCLYVFKCTLIESWLLAMTTVFVNSLLYIWPISLLMYGVDGNLPIKAIVVWDATFTFAFFIITTDLLVNRGQSAGKSLMRLAKNPVLVAIALGMCTNAHDELSQTAKQFASVGPVLALDCDVSSEQSVATAFSTIESTWGRIDALVNNAGVAVFKPILDTTYKEWRYVLDANLDGIFLCSQAGGQIMKRQGSGSIVNIASISGLRASTLRVAYGTSKAAVVHLTKQYAVELGAIGIRVNAVAPGPVETEMAKLVHTPAIRKDYKDAIPLERYGSCEEIANAVGFLCSPAASYINGQVLAVDGGFDASGVGLPTLRTVS